MDQMNRRRRENGGRERERKRERKRKIRLDMVGVTFKKEDWSMECVWQQPELAVSVTHTQKHI